MERPLCPLCRMKHYAREGHVFEKETAQVVATARPTTEAKADGMQPAPVSRFNRVAYQRVYMKSYRRRQALIVQTAEAVLGGLADRWPR